MSGHLSVDFEWGVSIVWWPLFRNGFDGDTLFVLKQFGCCFWYYACFNVNNKSIIRGEFVRMLPEVLGY